MNTHHKPNDNIVSFDGEFRFLSNFYPAKVYLDGYDYPTVEHAYQAAKTEDPLKRVIIRFAESPGKAKKLAREYCYPTKKDWPKVKVEVMYKLLQQKFFIPALRAQLDSTGNRTLIEGNNWGDVFWGVDVLRGGKNMLGLCLMNIREGNPNPPDLVPDRFANFYSDEVDYNG